MERKIDPYTEKFLISILCSLDVGVAEINGAQRNKVLTIINKIYEDGYSDGVENG